MSKYLAPIILDEMNIARKEIFAIRANIYKKYKIDVLDTDALSALSIYEVVSQYDTNYNINFSRNGEDAKSGDVHIEMKASRVSHPYTKRGKLRKNADRDAVFLFHAMGDIEHKRYLFVARDKDDLSIKRVYDIAGTENCKKIYLKLLEERNAWLERGKLDQSKMKHDVISIHETFLLELFPKKNPLTIDTTKIYKDW
jgi:hypothetical protein